MKRTILTTILTLGLISAGVAADPASSTPTVYVNQNLGFNVKGYKYSQSQFPCDIDKVLVQDLVERGKDKGINMEPVNTPDKIHNGVVPVLAIDIDQLVLGDKHSYGTERDSSLPKVQVTVALIKNKDEFVTAKHTCAIATLNELTPTTNILDLGANGVTVCSATEKCLVDLSKDIVDWVAPQVK